MKKIFRFGGEPSWGWAWWCGGTVRLGLGFILVGMACIHAVGQPGRIDLFSNGAGAPVYGPDSVDCYTTEFDSTWNGVTGEDMAWDFWNGKPLPTDTSGLAVSRSSADQVSFDAMPPDSMSGGFILEFGKWSSSDSADTDGDGAIDLAEAAFGSSPLQANSVPTVPLTAVRRVAVEVVAPRGSRY